MTANGAARGRNVLRARTELGFVQERDMGAEIVTAVPLWTDLRGVGAAQVYPKDVELFGQGQVLDEVLFVESGVVKLTRTDGNGQESILQLAFSGTWLGTATAIARTPSPTGAITCSQTRIGRMSAAAFRDLLRHDSVFAQQVHQLHARELCRQTGWIGQLSALTSRQRLQRVIRQLIVVLGTPTSGRGVRLPLPLRHWELARLIAVTPEHLSRLLKELQDEGIIGREKGWVIVADMQRLCPDGQCDDAPWGDVRETHAQA
jgi:CRP-like cAMP-binding protein